MEGVSWGSKKKSNMGGSWEDEPLVLQRGRSGLQLRRGIVAGY